MKRMIAISLGIGLILLGLRLLGSAPSMVLYIRVDNATTLNTRVWIIELSGKDVFTKAIPPTSTSDIKVYQGESLDDAIEIAEPLLVVGADVTGRILALHEVSIGEIAQRAKEGKPYVVKMAATPSAIPPSYPSRSP